LTFTSTGITKINDETLEIAGHLQIKGQTHPVVLKAAFAGIAIDPYGQTKAGMTLSGSIKRSDDIKLAAELQFIKQ
jgi:polyisoprenoid-binding protein YceI